MSFYLKDVHRALESFYHSEKGKEVTTLEITLPSFHYNYVLLVMESYYALKTNKDVRVEPVGFELHNLTEYLKNNLSTYVLMEFTELKLDSYTKFFIAFNESMGVEVDTSDDPELFDLMQLCYPLTIDVKIEPYNIINYWRMYVESYINFEEDYPVN